MSRDYWTVWRMSGTDAVFGFSLLKEIGTFSTASKIIPTLKLSLCTMAFFLFGQKCLEWRFFQDAEKSSRPSTIMLFGKFGK